MQKSSDDIDTNVHKKLKFYFDVFTNQNVIDYKILWNSEREKKTAI